jgi:uncharacterized protein (DUF2336 family)
VCACCNRPTGSAVALQRGQLLRQALVTVSSFDFRQIAERGDRSKNERLFRAAITAFCSLTRPSRNEIAKLEDLTLPLYDGVSIESLRFVAAALSEVEYAPIALIRRLAGESVDISAPLLLRSRALGDVDLIGLIGRHGLAHARVIGKRANLNSTIADLVRALNRSELRMVRNEPIEKEQPMKPALAAAIAEVVPVASAVEKQPRSVQAEPGSAAEAVREKLRAMMTPATSETPDWVAAEFSRGPRPGVYERLKGTALTGVRELFQTALADALAVDFRQARAITQRSAFGDLLAALKFLELPEEHAFVIAAALHPGEFGHAEAIRLFMRRYHLIHRDQAADRVRGWKEATLAAALKPEPQPTVLPHMPANNPGKPIAFGKALKAS